MSDLTARPASCTIARPGGEFCDAPAFDGLPFPVCGRHAAELYRAVRERMDGLASDPLGFATRMIEASDAEDRRRYANMPVPREEVVYYVRLGDHVKIGYTSDLKARMNKYGPTARLLATERGTMSTESARLRQFAQYLDAGKEWFRPGPRLMAHIRNLKTSVAA